MDGSEAVADGNSVSSLVDPDVTFSCRQYYTIILVLYSAQPVCIRPQKRYVDGPACVDQPYVTRPKKRIKLILLAWNDVTSPTTTGASIALPRNHVICLVAPCRQTRVSITLPVAYQQPEGLGLTSTRWRIPPFAVRTSRISATERPNPAPWLYTLRRTIDSSSLRRKDRE